MKKLIAWFRKQKKDIKFWLMIAGAGVFLVALLAFATLEVTSQPVFCSVCHYMKPYYEEWKITTHNKVNCLDCHAKPGINNYLLRKVQAIHEVVSMMTGIYPTRPHAQVDDASCLREGCHQTRLLKEKGSVPFKKGVVFDHIHHLTQERNGRNLRCTSCHAQMVMGSHMAVTEDVCFMCHFKNAVSGTDTLSAALCIKCHTVPPQELTIKGTGATFTHEDYLKDNVSCLDCHGEIVRGTGEVPRVMCAQCHNDPKRFERMDDHVFMHDNHVTKHKVECYRCHTEIKHTIQREVSAIQPGQCNRCHGNGHQGAGLLYAGTGARGVADQPSSMYLAHVNCIGCHRNRTGDPAMGIPLMRTAGPDGCVACHDKEGGEYLADWNQQLIASLAVTTATLGRAEKTAGITANPEAARLLADARHNIAFVKGANGVHNIVYAVDVLEKSKGMLEEAIKTAKAK